MYLLGLEQLGICVFKTGYGSQASLECVMYVSQADLKLQIILIQAQVSFPLKQLDGKLTLHASFSNSKIPGKSLALSLLPFLLICSHYLYDPGCLRNSHSKRKIIRSKLFYQPFCFLRFVFLVCIYICIRCLHKPEGFRDPGAVVTSIFELSDVGACWGPVLTSIPLTMVGIWGLEI